MGGGKNNKPLDSQSFPASVLPAIEQMGEECLYLQTRSVKRERWQPFRRNTNRSGCLWSKTEVSQAEQYNESSSEVSSGKSPTKILYINQILTYAYFHSLQYFQLGIVLVSCFQFSDLIFNLFLIRKYLIQNHKKFIALTYHFRKP